MTESPNSVAGGDSPSADVESLAIFHQDQRDQLAFRRTRESEIFGWSATLLIAVAGAMILAPNPESDLPEALRGSVGGLVVLFITSVVTLFSVLWQLKQRRYASLHQRMLAQLSACLGAFESGRFVTDRVLYPEEWISWGTRYQTLGDQLRTTSKISATLLLGIAAAFATIARYFPSILKCAGE